MDILWIFPIYAFLGWCLEVIYAAVSTGKLVNRGFLGGFICPIYGLGAGLIILALTPVAGNIFLLFLGAALLGSLLELVAGFLLKSLFHITWWDYSDEPFNIGGFICLKFSLVWGVVGVGLIHFIHPAILDLIRLIPSTVLWVLLALFYVYFITDIVTTVLTIRDLNRDLREITRLSELINKSGENLARRIGTPAIEAAQKFEDTRAKLGAKLEDSERLHALLEKTSNARLRLFRAFPNMKTARNGGALREMKERIKTRVRRRGKGKEE